MRGRGGLSALGIALASLALTGPAAARDRPLPANAAAAVRIEPGSLSSALARIAAATGAEIVSIEPELGRVAVPAQVLPAQPAAALARLLSGTGFRARRIGPATFRIERAPRQRPRAAPPSEPPADTIGAEPVTVVASKFPTRLRDYPGTLARLPQADGADLPPTTRLADMARRSPVLFSTAFGEGRDKTFIRGIADSSFNGASQPTTAIYFDDAPIALGSPNANLRLYDVASVEVLEGPQGTLYGGGSLGGVIRITPNPIDLDRVRTAATGQVSQVDGGGTGWRLGGMANLPLASGKAGLRVVGYDEHDPGFIDLTGGPRNVNAVNVIGGRAAVGFEPDTSLKLDASGFYQRTRSNDAQYVDRTRSMARVQAVPQPFSSWIALGRMALRKRWDSGLTFTGTASLGYRSSFDRFDATLDSMQAGATVYDLQRTSSVWSGEARLSRTSARGVSWVTGVNVERIEDSQSRAFGSPDGALALDEVSNLTRSASLFAQVRWPLAERLDATAGLRYTIARTDSVPARGRIVSPIKGRTANHFDPTLALLWRFDDRLTMFARFQTGYRNGGVTVARGVGRVADFRPDSLIMGELGLRHTTPGPRGFDLSGTVSYAHWNDVLADQVTRRGTPITTNIGRARLLAVEGSASWRSGTGWRLGASALVTSNRLYPDLAGQPPAGRQHLPDTPTLTGQMEASYSWGGEAKADHALYASLHYVGPSVLGPAPLLDIRQGGYAVVDVGGTRRLGQVRLRLSVDNLLNTRANRFSLGNPLLLYRRDGAAPLQPRTIAAGLEVAM